MRLRAGILALVGGALMFLSLGFSVQMGWLPAASQVTVRSVYSEQALGIKRPSFGLETVPSVGDRRLASSTQELDLFEALWRPALAHGQKTLVLWDALPRECVTGETESDFQSKQCAEFWNDLVGTTFYGFAPFLTFLALAFVVSSALFDGYRRIRRIVRRGKASGIARLDRELHPGFDLWAWLHCMRRLQVELPGGRRAVVYLPLSEAVPNKGTHLAIFPLGARLGQKRYVAQLHLPHLAIIRGSRP